jgi:hypothetical protein
MRVWAEIDDAASRAWVFSLPTRINLQTVRLVTQGIEEAHRYMLGSEVLGKWPILHEDVYPPPTGKGEVPGKYWSAPRTVPTRVTGRLAYSVSAPAATNIGFGRYQRQVGPRVWYAARQEYGFFSPRFGVPIAGRPFASRTADWLSGSSQLDTIIDNAINEILR